MTGRRPLVIVAIAVCLAGGLLARDMALAPGAAELARWGALAGAPRDRVAALRLRWCAAFGRADAARTLGEALLERHDDAADGMRWLERAANRGDPASQLAWGRRLLGRDPAKARVVLQQAAEHGQPAAAHHLALLLRRGAPGVPADPAEAMRWLRAAAEADIPDSQFLLGQALMSDGDATHAAQARSWFERAAAHEHPEAALQLALAYQRGELGLTPDPEEAARHMKEAEHALHHRPRAP